MTRQKKTRSGGSNGQRHVPAQEARKVRAPKEETKKKGAGLKSGSRNSVAATKPAGQTSSASKDKRIGSKKPIALVPEPRLDVAEIKLPKATLSKAKPETLTAEQELAQIENDALLQQLLERVERDEILTGKDAKYFNAKTARLEQLMQQLGLEEETDPMAELESTDWRKDLLGDD